MGRIFERMAKRLLRPFGYEMTKRAPGLVRNAFRAQQEICGALGLTAPVVLDVGANRGGTVKQYRTRFPESEVYCFEPFPASVESLRQRFAGDGKVHVVAQAVADKKGRREFCLNERDVTHSLLPRPSSGRRYYPRAAGPAGKMEVEVTSLDEFVKERGLASVGIMKMDIQGGELLALQGARGLLQGGSVALILTEVAFVPHYEGSPMFHDLWAFLAQFGYTPFNLYNTHIARNGQLRYADALFVSASARAGAIDRFPEEP